MSKMKYLLLKLHIGGGGFQNHHRLATADAWPVNISSSQPATLQTTFQSSTSSVLVGAGAAVSTADNSVDFNFFEEEFQMQLALVISVSDPETSEGPKTAQIKAAKQRSLECSTSDTLIDILSHQY